MATLALAVDKDSISDSEQVVTYDGALGDISVQLPAVVSGGGGAAAPFDHEIEFQNNGDNRLEIQEDGTGVAVFRMEPFSSVVLRSTGDLSGNPPWVVSDLMLEILAVAEASHIVDLTMTDPTSADSAAAASTGDSFDGTAQEAAFDTALDTVADNFESEMATAFAQAEVTTASIHAALATANIVAAS